MEGVAALTAIVGMTVSSMRRLKHSIFSRLHCSVKTVGMTVSSMRRLKQKRSKCHHISRESRNDRKLDEEIETVMVGVVPAPLKLSE